MKIHFASGEATTESFPLHRFNLVVVPRFQEEIKGKVPELVKWLPRTHAIALSNRISDTEFSGKAGQRCALDFENGAFRILLVGLGTAPGDAVNRALRQVGAAMSAEISSLKPSSVAVLFESVGSPVGEQETISLLEAFFGASYRFSKYQTGEASKYISPKKVTLRGFAPISETEIRQLQSLTKAVSSARDLINMPPNDCTPSYLANFSEEIAKKGGLKCRILDRKKLEQMGSHTLLSVAKGSEQPPFLITLKTPSPAKKGLVVALVGKGVTFDSGGLSLKTGAAMMEMKADMSGAAAVIGAMTALAERSLPIEVRAYIPTVENMVNGKATRPGDVVKSLDGQTVEILNTDAEGRLILCDAITLAEREGADVIIDVATLTGACVVALGTKYAGLFSDDEELCHTILDAARRSGELFWRLPLATEYDELLKSSVADVKNIGNQWGGAITAALFLKRFVKKARWAHLDIAGPAFDESGGGSTPKGGAGFAVKTLVRAVEILSRDAVEKEKNRPSKSPSRKRKL
jgi:leucyl aminopeptidase